MQLQSISSSGGPAHLYEYRAAKSDTWAVQSASALLASPCVHSCMSRAVVLSVRLFTSTCAGILSTH